MSTVKSKTMNETFWYLEGYMDADQRGWRTMIRSFPMTVGRSSSADVRLRSNKVSNVHLELFLDDGGIRLRDLDSTNGTFVNFNRVSGEVELAEGDVILIGDREFRLARYESSDFTATTTMSTGQLRDYFTARERDFHVIMRSEAVVSHLQPMVSLGGEGELFGFEVLSRGSVDGAQIPPAELFSVAEKLGREEELSELCRTKGMGAASRLPAPHRIFLNTHPRELERPRKLVDSLLKVSKLYPDIQVVLEVHEAAATGARRIRRLREELESLGYELAFDDFGAGRSRFKEIAEASPHYLKFDKGLIRNLHKAEQRMQLLASLVPTVESMGIQPVAEGVETPEEASACRELGFRLAQGYYFGHPQPVEALGVEPADREVGGSRL